MSTRLEFETLADWVDGRLDPDRADAVAAQVAQPDPRTRAIVDWLRGFVEVGRQFPLDEPPAIVRQRLSAHFAAWHETEHAIAGEIRSFDATVLFDSRTRPALAGVRGAIADEVVHLGYSTEAADVVLDVRRLPGHRVRIDGQVLPSDVDVLPVFEATVSGPGFTLRTMDGDRLGRFRIDGVPEDAEQLQVTNGEISVTARLDLRRDEP